MLRNLLITWGSSLAFAISLAAAPDAPPSRAKLSAAEVVDRNVTARGGLQAWRAVQTMSLSGKLGAGGNQRATLQTPMPDTGPSAAKEEAAKSGRGSKPDMLSLQKLVPKRPVNELQLPFLMELQRPRKMRFELQFNGQAAVQVYDGTNGWKLRPFLNRRVVEPYTADELKVASMQADLDGPLMDYAAKGTRIELAGTEKVEDRDTYKIKMTMKSGQVLHVWIDAGTFLEAKIEGQPRRLDGADHPVEIYFRDYRTVNGLHIPFILETKVLPVAKNGLGLRDTPVPPETITIEKVEVNPKLDASRFSKPEVVVASNK